MIPGDSVAANVRLERMLSEGGMGSVWVADHLTLNTKVAVKFMTAELAAHPEALSRFKREASASARVKSPHIVQVFDHGVTTDGVPYIVMELLHGEDLEERLSRGPLSLRDTLEVTRQVLKALGSAHREGIIHRDIKPPNIYLLDVDGDVFVKVLDFGIAKQKSDDRLSTHMTRSGALLGTPHYMSPEQMMGSLDLDARSDLWAVGVVAYRALTGSPPFDGETIGALSVAINAAEFTPPSAIVSGLPAAVDAWFSRALARRPEARFATAREMADALTEAVPRDQRSLRPSLSSSTIAVVPVTGVGTEASTEVFGTANTIVAVTNPSAPLEPPPPKRRPALMALGGGMLLLGGLVASVAYATRHASTPVSSVHDLGPAPSGSTTITSGASSAVTILRPLAASTDSAPTPTDAPPLAGNESTRTNTVSTVAITNAGRAPHAHPSVAAPTETSPPPPPPPPKPIPLSPTGLAGKDRGF